MLSADPSGPDALLDGQRLSDWIEAAGISRSTAYALVKLLAIEPEPRRVPGSRKPVSFLTAEHLERIEPLAQQFRDGVTLRDVERMIKDSPGSSRTEPDRAGLSRTIPDGSPMEALAAALARIAPQPPPADPLRVARLLQEAATLGAWLSGAELAQLLGMSPSTITRLGDGHSPRPGFRLERQQPRPGAPVWWRVVAADGSTRPLPSLAAARRVGFGGGGDVIEARFEVVPPGPVLFPITRW